jgi:hypothetical protein
MHLGIPFAPISVRGHIGSTKFSSYYKEIMQAEQLTAIQRFPLDSYHSAIYKHEKEGEHLQIEVACANTIESKKPATPILEAALMYSA